MLITSIYDWFSKKGNQNYCNKGNIRMATSFFRAEENLKILLFYQLSRHLDILGNVFQGEKIIFYMHQSRNEKIQFQNTHMDFV